MAEEAVAETVGREDPRALLAALIDSSNDAIIGKDLRGLVTSWNRAAEELLGYSAGEMVGRSILTIIPASRVREEDDILQHVRAGRRLSHFETERVTRSGRLLPVSLSVSPIRNADGQIVGVSKIMRDLSAQRQVAELQAELLHVSRLGDLGQMASALAHEVSQPLAAIRFYIGGMRRLLPPDARPELAEGLEKISEQAQRAREIVQGLRRLVQKEEAPRAPHDLNRLIAETVALALAGTGGSVHLDIDVAPDASHAVVDKVQIQQVLLNLMRNAVQALKGRPAARLSVATRRLGDRIEIRVSDNGPGLSPAVRKRLFQPFVTTKPDGLGVGLSICRTIVEAHGGSLEVSDAGGGGARFRFSVPAAEPGEAAADAAQADPFK